MINETSARSLQLCEHYRGYVVDHNADVSRTTAAIYILSSSCSGIVYLKNIHSWRLLVELTALSGCVSRQITCLTSWLWLAITMDLCCCSKTTIMLSRISFQFSVRCIGYGSGKCSFTYLEMMMFWDTFIWKCWQSEALILSKMLSYKVSCM